MWIVFLTEMSYRKFVGSGVVLDHHFRHVTTRCIMAARIILVMTDASVLIEMKATGFIYDLWETRY